MITGATLPKKLVVLISGSGSNLQSFIDGISNNSLPARIAAVISNRPNVKGLDRAANAGIPSIVVNHKDFDERDDYDRRLMSVIDAYEPDAVILAGFMRILGSEFVTHYAGRLFNIHPSLLPKYPGLHTHQRAIDAKDIEAGATVHFVVPELDAGPIIIQARVPIEPDDDAQTLARRVLAEEHKIYPLAIRWFLENRLALTPHGATLDGSILPPSGSASLNL